MRGRRTLVRLRGVTAEDDYGNETTDWEATMRDDLERCALQPETGLEVTLGRQTVVDRWRLYAQPDADLLPTDRIEDPDDGVVYEIDGSVQTWTGLHGGYVTALLMRSS